MKNITKHILVFLILLPIAIGISFTANAQIAINENGNAPDSSAMLDVSSSDKGLLVPRMSTTDRNNISNPTTGLLVYDTITVSFWYYDDAQWNEIRNGNTALTASDIFDELPDLDFSCLEITGELDFSGFVPFSLAVSGDYAYIGLGTGLVGEFRIIDVSDPTAPSSISNLNIGTGVNDVAVSGDYAYILDGAGDFLRVIDVNDPTAPNLIGALAIDSAPQEIVLSGNYAYIVNIGSDDLKIIDISNPTAPSLTGSLGLGGLPRSLAISNNYVYVVDSDSDDLKIIDVSNPAAPSLSGSLTIGDLPLSIEVSNNYAYVVDADDGDIKIIDVSNPVAPSLSGSLVIGTTPFSIAVLGKYAYVVDGDDGDMKIIDVSDPAAPSLSASLELGNSPRSIALGGNYAYVLDGSDFDLKTIQRSCPNNVIAFNSADGTFETVLNSDDQTIDKFELSGNTLLISLEDDGQSDISVDLTNLLAPVGTIQMWPTETAPSGWLLCDGSSFDTSTYPDLNSVLGGNTLPDFRGRFPLGQYSNSDSDNLNGLTRRNIGDQAGAETHTLTINEMPAHSHDITYGERSKGGSGNNVTDLDESGKTATSSSVGGNQAHNNMPPFYTINFIIKAE